VEIVYDDVSMMLFWFNSSRGLHITTAHQNMQNCISTCWADLLFIGCSCVFVFDYMSACVCFFRVGCLT